MNIIIPMNGTGQRFVDEHYREPKPLIKIHGRPMIFWVIDNLNIDKTDNVIIIHNSQLEEYDFHSVISNEYQNLNFKFVSLGYQTRGAAETILCGLNNISTGMLEQPCMLVDCDTIYFDDIVTQYKNNFGNTIFYFKDHEKKPIYSYIKLDDNNNIVDIREKEKISNNANTGAYCFESGTLLKKYCQVLLNSGKREKNEFYISGVYKKILEDNLTVSAEEVKRFHCVGTPLQLQWFASNPASTQLRICFDIDNTLVTYPKIKGDYSTVDPIPKAISFLKFLKSMGHYIILYTARRMKTHKGNIGAVVADIGEVTIETLERFNIPYDEIHFGKPYAHCYIDDLAVNPKQSLEKQTGFYKTNIEPRDFHNIELRDTSVIKGSATKADGPEVSQRGHLASEAYWYKNIPDSIRDHFPKIYSVNDDETSIEMERINGVAFSYLYVNNSLTKHNLKSLLDSLSKVHYSDLPEQPQDIDIYANYTKKLRTRYCDYDYSRFHTGYQTYKYIEQKLREYESNDSGCIGIVHGDPVFTNVLLDTNNNVKMIDPRGLLGDQKSIYGDIFYDYAKVYQSLIGYDFILLDKAFNSQYMLEMINCFENYIHDKFGKDRLELIKAITASLLFTLIPLHDNEKCKQYYNLIRKII